MHASQAREFCNGASEAVRSYIERRFEILATRNTTEEFLQHSLRTSNELLVRHRAQLADFLQQCDHVKFAGAALTDKDMEALLQSALSFVHATTQRARK